MAPVAEDLHDALPLERWVRRFLTQDPGARYLALPVSCARVENLPVPAGADLTIVLMRSGRCGAHRRGDHGVDHYCAQPGGHCRFGHGFEEVVADGYDRQFAAQVDPIARVERDARFAIERAARDMPGA